MDTLMNYPLFSNPFDLLIGWIGVMFWIGVGAVLFRAIGWPRRTPAKHGYWWCAVLAFLCLCVAFAIVQLVGLIFLNWLHVSSSFWMIWELMWLMTALSVFRVLPFVCVGVLSWALLRAGISRPAIFSAMTCALGVALNIALYFLLEF